MINNKKSGNDFEIEFAQTLSNSGYWAHKIVGSKNGQPADIFAVKDCKPYLIDCKECINDKFELDRIELNQHLAAKCWRNCGNGEYLFALKTSEGVYIMSYANLARYGKAGRASVNLDQIKTFGCRLEDWM
ncbi:MAG: hypothetical protein ACI4F9_01055 [Lachnospiraceae bacterium]